MEPVFTWKKIKCFLQYSKKQEHEKHHAMKAFRFKKNDEEVLLGFLTQRCEVYTNNQPKHLQPCNFLVKHMFFFFLETQCHKYIVMTGFQTMIK